MSGCAHWSDVCHLLVDPVDRTPLHHHVERDLLVSESGDEYEIVGDVPILLASGSRESAGWSFPAVRSGQQADLRPSDPSRRTIVDRLKRALRGDRVNATATRHIETFLTSRPPDRRCVLIIGGGTVGAGSEPLFDIADTTIVSFDVYASANTTFVADGHQIPVASESIDVVWVQAVLEHVAQPSVVVDELTRVLVSGGLVYAETPFLQPVHEGPYDFARFTHSGHRLLFAGFDEIDAGPIGGPGAMLALALRGLIGGLTRSRRASKLTYAATAALGSLDRAIPSEWRIDYATGTHFLGAKQKHHVREYDATTYYRGAQR